MSRLALVVSESSADQTLEQLLQRHGFARVIHNSSMAQALGTIDREPVELLIAPIEAVDESQRAALDRLNRRERGIGIIATGDSTDPQGMLRGRRAGGQTSLVRP